MLEWAWSAEKSEKELWNCVKWCGELRERQRGASARGASCERGV